MIKNKATTAAITAATAAVLFAGFAAIPASAEVSLNTSSNANITVTTQDAMTGSSAKADAKAAVVAKMETGAKDKSDQEIDRRVTSLNDLMARISSMKNVSDMAKSTLSSDTQAQISALTDLKAKIDADTDAATLKTDKQSILGSYRIFALVMPRTRIIASVDRLDTIDGITATLGTKLQARITDAQSKGTNVTAAQAALADYNAKIADAKVQYQNAANIVIALAPDNGDKTVMASNTKALIAARADLKASQDDYRAARKDVDTIRTALGKASVTATTTTTVNAQ